MVNGTFRQVNVRVVVVVAASLLNDVIQAYMYLLMCRMRVVTCCCPLNKLHASSDFLPQTCHAAYMTRETDGTCIPFDIGR